MCSEYIFRYKIAGITISISCRVKQFAVFSRNDKLYFGSLGRVCYFNPERLAAFRQVPEVKIVECTQLAGSPDGQVVESVLPVQRGRVEIPYRGNSFRISFSVSDYAQSSLVEYAYQIEGLVRH